MQIDISRDDKGILVKTDLFTLHFTNEKEAERMAFDILLRLGHRFNDGKHMPAPTSPPLPQSATQPVYKIHDMGKDTDNRNRVCLIVGNHWFHDDEARDLAFLLNKARAERISAEKSPRRKMLDGEI